LTVAFDLSVLVREQSLDRFSNSISSDADSGSSYVRSQLVHSVGDFGRALARAESFASWLSHHRSSVRHLVDDGSFGLALHKLHLRHLLKDGTLNEQLSAKLEGANEKDKFIPAKDLESLLCESRVTLELMEFSEQSNSSFWKTVRTYGNVRDVAKWICQGGGNPRRCLRKIFATLVLIGHPSAIEGLISERLCDEDLPLERRRDPDFRRWCLYRKNGLKVDCSANWEPKMVVSFAEWQWKVFVPVFSHAEDGLNYGQFQEKAILPFTSVKLIKSGGHGDIYDVKIHPQHHNFPAQVRPSLIFKLYPHEMGH